MRIPRLGLVALYLVLAVLVLSHGVSSAKAKKSSKKTSTTGSKDQDKQDQLCNQCRSIASKFISAVKTKASSIDFAGKSKGWTKDNEKFLGRYDMDEALLYDALEDVCEKDHTCGAVLEEVEDDIEEWWTEQSDDDKDDEDDKVSDGGKKLDVAEFTRWLCVDKKKYCCPSGHYGPKCKPCAGGAEKPCSGHGGCNGDGHRYGKGTCSCYNTFAGPTCNECQSNHHPVYSSEDPKIIERCEPCSPACAGNCTGPGADQCLACASGYSDVAGTCTDIDECAVDPPACAEKPNTYCSNQPGSFACEACDPACADGCSGAGMAKCKACASGYETDAEKGGCRDIDECQRDGIQCEKGRFCRNLPGSHECAACDASCDPEQGCTAEGNKGCVACATGYARDTEAAGCEEVNECKVFPCSVAETCRNTVGSHECRCDAPSQEEDGKCQLPAWLAAMSTAAKFPDANRDAPLPKSSKLHKASITVGKSDSAVHGVNVTFSDALTQTLKDANGNFRVVRVQSVKECCGDKFSFQVLGLTEAGLTLVTRRVDVQEGWGQDLQVQYFIEIETERVREEL